MKTILSATAPFVLTIALAQSAGATTITFDDITTGPVNGYQGFNWSKFNVTKDFAHGNAGLPTNMNAESPPNFLAASSDNGSPQYQNGPPVMGTFSSPNPFTLNSIDFLQYGWLAGSDSVTVLGTVFGNGTPTLSVTVPINTVAYTHEIFDWTDLSAVSIYSNKWNGLQPFGLDNLVVNNAIPVLGEPGTLSMLSVGAMLLALIRRKPSSA